MPDRTMPEALCFWTFALTWPFYAIGGLYIVGPALAWGLGLLALLSLYLGPALRNDLQPAGGVPPVVWGWIAGMGFMLLALWAGHINWDLGLDLTIKSSIGWAKGWAMMAVLPLAGAVLQIRREVLIRAQCVIGLQTLLLLPLMLPAPYIGLPSKIFVSPLQAAGGPGPEYFTLYLYTLDPETWTPRWQFYAPWSPFAGLLGVTMVLFALEEKHRGWLISGVLAGIAMIWFSKSRMSLVGLLVCAALPRVMPLLQRSLTWKVCAGLAAVLAIFGSTVQAMVFDAIDAFNGARASSTRVRNAIQRIGYERWQTEAVWFGHGTVTRGPHIVEFMPIGSHHTWYGLLFVKGLVGVFALLGPMLWQTWVTLADAVRGPRGRLPFGLMLNFIILTFGENMEIEAYLLWPAILLLGVHAREMAQDPSKALSRQAAAA